MAPGLTFNLIPAPILGQRGKHWESKRNGADMSIPKHQAAAAAGLSKRQADTAQHLANVPDDVFEDMCENGATVTDNGGRYFKIGGSKLEKVRR
ncbi:hypothetical protein ROJ8625_03774 [Roseivivax jejudonensis]|uniref:Uncharacterized protein n=1 Tax=Roseivivax jejudonensis TaxID=1529041 RepID=A0A1X7A6N6_9RHOB|nr:hypothetical protein [Roseivivax jejudonensis]SLN72018.1 hypothetical protein ROJ8625_03774 [Roseivivax jejudonensis]